MALPLIYNRYFNLRTFLGSGLSFKLLIINIQKLYAILNSLVVYNYVILGSRNIYAKSVFKSNALVNFYKRGKYSGFLSNFCMVLKEYCVYSNFLLEFRPDILISLALQKNISFLAESKQNRVPIVGVCNFKKSVLLFDYPLVVNTKFFYSVYYFSKIIISHLCN